tara:strand:+ start:144 stop:446 length:303 start_codon:yes stop_codon:yes gene_type:complete
MTDKEILEKAHERLTSLYMMLPEAQDEGIKDLKDYIEREWQKRDEEEMREQYNRNRPAEEHIHYPETVPSFSKHWYADVRDVERHRGLEIGEDGTVKDLK